MKMRAPLGVLLGLVTLLRSAAVHATPTVSVLDVVPGTDGLMPGPPFAYGGAAYVTGTTSDVTGLWRTEGTLATTSKLVSLPSSAVTALGAVSGGFVFMVGDVMYRSDGTAAGTTAVTTFARPAGATSVGYRFIGSTGSIAIFFAGYNPGVTSTMLRTDGTAAGTYRIGPVNDDTSPIPGAQSFVARGYLYYADAANSRLRRTDGSTVEVVGTMDPSGRPFTACAGVAYYIPLVGSPQPLTSITTGVPANLGPAANAFGCTGSKLVFARATSTPVLAVTDGTVAGTTVVSSDFHPGASKSMTAGGFAAFLGYSTDPSKVELWSSDGTSAGTKLLTTLPDRAMNPIGATASHAYFYDSSRALLDFDGTSVHPAVPVGMPGGTAGAVQVGRALVSRTSTTTEGSELWVLNDADPPMQADAGDADGSAADAGPGPSGPDGGPAGGTNNPDRGDPDNGEDGAGDAASSGCTTAGVGVQGGGLAAVFMAVGAVMIGRRRRRASARCP